MPEPAEQKPEEKPEQKLAPLVPLLGAVVCYAMFRVAFYIFALVIGFFGGVMVAITVPLLMAGTVSNALSMATFESKGLSDLGLNWGNGSGKNVLLGLALGIGSAALVVLGPLMTGAAQYHSIAGADVSWRAALFMPALLMCGALGEEIAFRGFVLQYLIRGWGAWVAILSTGALFGWLHNENPNATLLSGVNTAAFGILFGLALLRSHDLWLPFGIHFGWNVTLPFLGVTLSGLTIRVTGYEIVWKTGDLWSGGMYGPEGSVLTSMVLALLFVLVWKLPVHKGHAWLLDQQLEQPLEPRPDSGSLPAV